MGPIPAENALRIAATEYPGCFTHEHAHPLLGRPGAEKVGDDDIRQHHDPEKIATLDNHFLPDCICSSLHSACTGTPQETPERPFVNTTLEQLRVSADRGCWFCSAVYGGIVQAPPWDPLRPETVPIFPQFRMPLQKQAWDGPDFAIKPFGDSDHIQEPALYYYVSENEATSSPCKLFVARNQDPDQTDPRHQIAFAAQKLRHCIKNHSCGPSIPPSVPTRLLHVRVVDGKYVLNIEMDVSPQPYVTLSHCWGKSFPSGTVTNLGNLKSRISPAGIPWEVLPQTFRDAVAMTERLGFQYLWIDALCIIQDSPSDWLAESARMHDVYSHGALMLSADGSPDSLTGMFRAANMSTKPWRALQQTSPPSPDKDKTALRSIQWADDGIKVVHSPTHSIVKPGLAFSIPPEALQYHRPLTARAWCYQEQRLARRVIHMCLDEAMWSCAHGLVECQCGREGTGRHEFSVFAWQRNLADGDCSAKEKHTLWMNTIYNYTERELTVWTDRLPALSGLARQFQSTSREPELDQDCKRPFRDISLGNYLAGIWSSALPMGICWFGQSSPGKRLSTLANCYIAPSWSWASVSGVINWPHNDFQPRGEILDIRCDLAGKDETGSVCGGEVTVRARMIPLRLFYGYTQSSRTNGVRYASIHLEALNPFTQQFGVPAVYHPDFVPPEITGPFNAGADMLYGDGKTAERIHELTPLSPGEYFGLQMGVSFIMVVRPVPSQEPCVFERAGSLTAHWNGDVPNMTGWFRDADTQTIRIV